MRKKACRRSSTSASRAGRAPKHISARTAATIAILGLAVGWPGFRSPAHAAPTPVPSPTPTPPPRFVVQVNGSSLFVDQQAWGPGLQPPEGPGFAAGSPLSPMTPYDTWSGAPTVPGIAGVGQTLLTGAFNGSRLRAEAIVALGVADGSVTMASYWGENLIPALNAHLGSSALPYAVVFPTHAGQDDGSAARLSLYGASVGGSDGSWSVRGGYFDLAQSLRFIFLPPAFTSVTPALGLQPAESLGDGPPALDSWPASEPGLPLAGIDARAKLANCSIEAADALVPMLAGSTARLVTASLFATGAHDSTFALQALDLTTSGSPISTSTMFGADEHTVSGPQGNLPVSTLGNQHQTMLGASASFHAAPGLDAVVDLGRSWYDARNVVRPGTQAPGGYYHLALSHRIGSGALTVEGFRFEPRFATAILPYGVPENIWSVAWSWPGPWLKSTYQLADNSSLGVNRQGLRARFASRSDGPLVYRASIASYHQIEPATLANVTQTGFIDGFFLPQRNGFGTLGGSTQLAAWLAWRPALGSLSLDYVNDLLQRPAMPAHPEDFVGYVSPQLVFSFSRKVSSATLLNAGIGRYAMRGGWATTPLDYGQTTWFAGAQFAQSAHAGLLVVVRHSSFDGLPSQPGGVSPAFASNLVEVEERFSASSSP